MASSTLENLTTFSANFRALARMYFSASRVDG